jgi:hypothetical protein
MYYNKYIIIMNNIDDIPTHELRNLIQILCNNLYTSSYKFLGNKTTKYQDSSINLKDIEKYFNNEIDIRIIEWAFNRSDSDFLTTIRILNGNHVYDFGVTRGYHFNLYRNLEIDRNKLILNLLKYKDDFLKMDYIFLSMWRNLFLSRL